MENVQVPIWMSACPSCQERLAVVLTFRVEAIGVARCYGNFIGTTPRSHSEVQDDGWHRSTSGDWYRYRAHDGEWYRRRAAQRGEWVRGDDRTWQWRYFDRTPETPTIHHRRTPEPPTIQVQVRRTRSRSR